MEKEEGQQEEEEKEVFTDVLPPLAHPGVAGCARCGSFVRLVKKCEDSGAGDITLPCGSLPLKLHLLRTYFFPQ